MLMSWYGWLTKLVLRYRRLKAAIAEGGDTDSRNGGWPEPVRSRVEGRTNRVAFPAGKIHQPAFPFVGAFPAAQTVADDLRVFLCASRRRLEEQQLARQEQLVPELLAARVVDGLRRHDQRNAELAGFGQIVRKRSVRVLA